MSPTNTTDQKASNKSVGLAQSRIQRQINTNQMLSDIRQSIKDRDRTVLQDRKQHQSIGDKMNLDGKALDHAQLINPMIMTFDNKDKQLSI